MLVLVILIKQELGCNTRLGWEEADLDKIIEIFAKQEKSGWFKFIETE